jgi:hypothetical protein
MPKAIILTQYSAPSEAAAAAAPGLIAGGARSRVHYRLLEDPGQYASIDYAEELAAIDEGESSMALPPGVARYVCVESQDSGAYAEPHRVLMIVAFRVPGGRQDEVERWYQQEHGPMLLRAPGWLRMRRYRLHRGAGGPLWTHLALHELRDAAVLDSAERALARSTEWRARLEKERWFAQAGRFVYECLE